ncbi:Serine/threonine-protein kinase MARK2 [Smittium mucronatum]|uniref:non-specific serine/threonine protein kinase n=1 Tax=Smittium mucronatum TaxID=133383 RepID=A0A1R0H5C5_9FUNG|nr:Serine/threonine-protein kinase MARK2 [Smittium mucronatum]
MTTVVSSTVQRSSIKPITDYNIPGRPSRQSVSKAPNPEQIAITNKRISQAIKRDMSETAALTKQSSSSQTNRIISNSEQNKKPDVSSKSSKDKKEQRIGDFVIKSTLGKGTFSKVCMAEHRVTKQTFALKFIKPKSADSNSSNDKHSLRIEREIKLLSLLYHPNIVRLYDVVQTSKFTMIVMEHNSGGELLHYIRKRGRLMEREARVFFRQIVSAVDYIHRNNIIHRDLKLENVMLDGDQRIRLIDFGFANTFYWDRELDTFCGSPFYAAPEMVNGIKYIGPEVDIWSMGVILFFMLCGRTPFEGENLKEIYDKISKGRFVMPQFLSTSACDLLQRMLTVNPKKRITMAEIRSHPWINIDFEDSINSYLPARPAVVLDPNPQSLGKMHLYGFTQEQVIASLADAEQVNTPIVCIYHLVDESRRRKAAKVARRNQAHAAATVAAANTSSMTASSNNTNNSTSLVPSVGATNDTSISAISTAANAVSNGENVASTDGTYISNNLRISLGAQDIRPGNLASSTSVAGARKLSMYSISQDIREIKDVEGSKTPVFLDSPSILASQLGAGLQISKQRKNSDVTPVIGNSFNWESTSARDSEVNSSRMSKNFRSPSKLFARLRKSMPFLKFRKSMAFIDPIPLQKTANQNEKPLPVKRPSGSRFSDAPPIPLIPNAISAQNMQKKLPPTGQNMSSAATSSQTSQSVNNAQNPNPLSRTLSAHDSKRRDNTPIHNRRNTEFLSPTPSSIPVSSLLPQSSPVKRNDGESKKIPMPIPNPEVDRYGGNRQDMYSNKNPDQNSKLFSPKSSVTNTTTESNLYKNQHENKSPPNNNSPISGIFTIKTTILRTLDEIHNDLDRVLQSNSIAYRRITEYFFYCEDRSEFHSNSFSNSSTNSGNKFEIHITNIQGNLYTVKFKRLKGSWWTHKKLSQKLIKELCN